MLRMSRHRYRRLFQSAARLVAQVGCHPIGTCNPQTMGKGVESNSSESCIVKELSPVKIAPCTAAPCSTVSSGLMNCWILPLVARQVLAAILALEVACGSDKAVVKVFAPRCWSPAVAFTSKTPSSMVSRTRRRYLLPCLRSGLTLESLKWAGTITNVSLTSSPRYVSAVPFF